MSELEENVIYKDWKRQQAWLIGFGFCLAASFFGNIYQAHKCEDLQAKLAAFESAPPRYSELDLQMCAAEAQAIIYLKKNAYYNAFAQVAQMENDYGARYDANCRVQAEKYMK